MVDKTELLNATIIYKRILSNNIVELTIEYSFEIEQFRIPCHIRIYNNDTNANRPYSPIRQIGNRLIFIIKLYPNGVLSQYINRLEPGDLISTSKCIVCEQVDNSKFNNVLMIAGGTGLTPIYQVLEKELRKERQNTKYMLLNLNINEDNIFLRKELEDFEKSGRFKKTEILVEGPRDLNEGAIIGILNKNMLKNILGANNYDFVYICGPPALLDDFVGKKIQNTKQREFDGVLSQLGFSKDSVYRF